MTEKQYEKAMLALGCKDVTTDRQIANGTTAYKLPTGQVVSEHKSGYIRRYLYKETKASRGYFGDSTCYQLNPTYDVNHEYIGVDGKLRKTTRKERTKIWSRKTRLKKLFLYTTKKLNYEL
jgi:hypothetical protein